MRGIMDVGTTDGKAVEITLVVLDGYRYDEPSKSWVRVVPAADGKAARSALVALGTLRTAAR